MNTTELIKNFLEENEYKVLEVNDDGVVSVRYEMNVIHICPNKRDEEFVSLVMPGIDNVDSDNPLPVVMRCLAVCSQQKVVKAYPSSNDSVMLSYEFNFKSPEELLFQISTGLDALISGKVQYKRLIKEMN